MMGRDMGPTTQFKFGIRTAYLGADLTNSINASLSSGSCSASATGTCSIVSTALLSADERSSFIGTGPRFAVEGALPFSSSWGLQYGVGTAVLVGEQQLAIQSAAQAACVPSAGGSLSSLCFSTGTAVIGFVGLATIPSGTFPTNSVTAVFNVNAMAALAYSFSPNMIFSAGFRFDGYWDALKTVNATGALTNVNRLYYGPFARMTMRF